MDYAVKRVGKALDAISSNLGLKQGCPLSPMLFNIYMDDVNDIFDNLCEPIDIQDNKINHFLYADDLVLISQSKAGLQRCIDKLYHFSNRKHLTISTKKSKTMTFNPSGRLIKDTFNLGNKTLENVQTFCYLGFEVTTSGTVTHAMNTLSDKAKKALRPLMCTIARFNIPVKTAIRLFHTFISPILLYNAENWTVLTEKKLRNIDRCSIFSGWCKTSKVDIIHRKLLKYVLGVSKSCPNLAIYGDTGEIPMSLKCYRLMLNFWHRVTHLEDNSLAKSAMLENITLRTNWIKTVEKLINFFNLSDYSENLENFKIKNKLSIHSSYSRFWEDELKNPDLSRLQFYSTVKSQLKQEEYLEVHTFENRQIIAKLRCSDHSLEIEKGRHRDAPRENRICKVCTEGEIENEEHFLIKCNLYDNLRKKHKVDHINNTGDFMNNLEPVKLGEYLAEALKERECKIWRA